MAVSLYFAKNHLLPRSPKMFPADFPFSFHGFYDKLSLY